MTDPPLNPLTPSPAPPPRAPILNYLTPGGALTPTRVRRMASWIVAFLGMFLYIAGAWIWIELVLDVLGLIRYGFGISWVAWWRYENVTFYFAFFAGTLALASGITLLLLARPVRRGSTRAAVAATLFFALYLLISALLTALAGGIALLEFVAPLRNYPNPAHIRWFLAVLPGILIILLLKDTIAYLRWIARNPILEKPPVAFLPNSDRPIAPPPPGVSS